MLGKLLKYEIPALGRKLVPLYAAWAVTAILLGLSIGRVESKSEFGMVITVLLYMGVAAAVFVLGVVMLIQRYSHSLLGDEGYFYHVLPVSANEHIACKTISALIWILLTFLTLLVTFMLIALFSGTSLHDIMFGFTFWIPNEAVGTVVLLTIETIIAGLLSICKSVLAIYAAITIGHQAKNHTTLASIGAYIALMVLESTAGNILIHLVPNITYKIETASGVSILLLAAMVVTIIIGGFYFFICSELLRKRLNLA